MKEDGQTERNNRRGRRKGAELCLPFFPTDVSGNAGFDGITQQYDRKLYEDKAAMRKFKEEEKHIHHCFEYE